MKKFKKGDKVYVQWRNRWVLVTVRWQKDETVSVNVNETTIAQFYKSEVHT